MEQELDGFQATIGIIIPIYNEGKRFESFSKNLVDSLKAQFGIGQVSIKIVCVDDGSREPVKLPSVKLPNFVSIHLLRHKVNFGQGAALQTGIEFARDFLNCNFFVTMDSDGQHSAEDISKLFRRLEETKVDIVFGTRFANSGDTNVPFSRKIILKIAIIFENCVSGVKSTDAHNGFRIFNRKFAEAINLKQNKMAHATEFKLIVSKNKFLYTEEPVRIIYSDENMAKGQRNTGAFLIIRDLLRMLIFDRG